jgi:hypothetical protein
MYESGAADMVNAGAIFAGEAANFAGLSTNP